MTDQNETLEEKVEQLTELVRKCYSCLEVLMLKQTRTHYTVKEFAKVTGWSEYQIREWCKEGKIQAEKTKERRGAHTCWRIPHEERIRLTRESALAHEHSAD